MSKLLFLVPMGLWVALVGVPARADEAKKPDHLAIGFVHDHSVFAVDKGTEGRGEKGLNPSMIFKTPLIPKVKGHYAIERYNFWHGIAYELPYRWRIAHGCFWGYGGKIEIYEDDGWRVPLDELRFMDLQTEEQKALLRKMYPGFIGTSLSMFKWALGPTREIYWRSGGQLGLGRPPLKPPVYFDFLPVDKTTTLLFVIGRGKLQVWETTATYSKEKVQWVAKYKARKDLHMKADFVEPFNVYEMDGAYYFVTVSGKLYGGKPIKDDSKPKKEEGKVVPLWTDAKRSICAVITDTASKKTFIFTEPAQTDANEQGYRYFELAEKIAAKPYEVKPVTDSKVPRALRQVLPYTDFLLRENKVK